MAASGSNLRLAFVEEVTWGTTPTTPQTKILSGITSESLGGSQAELKSQALNPNRGVDFVAAGQKQAQGDLSFELGIKGAVSLLARMLGTVATTGTGPYTHKLSVATGPKSISLEKWFSDLSLGFVFKGVKANTFAMDVNPDGIATGTIGVIAQDYVATTSELDSTPTASSHAFFDGIRAQVKIGGTTYAKMLNFSMNMTNNLQPGNAIGSDKLVSLTPGVFDITGSFSIPFEDTTIINKVINGTEDSLEVIFNNGSYSVSFLFPRIKYSGDPIPKAGGQGQVNIDLNFSALLDNTPASPTLNKAILVTVINDEATL